MTSLPVLERESEPSAPPLLWLAYYVPDRAEAIAVSLSFGVLVSVAGNEPPVAVNHALTELALQVGDYLKTTEIDTDILRPASVEACLEHFYMFLEIATHSPDKRSVQWDYGTTLPTPMTESPR